MASDSVELSLPLKPQYLLVLRATVCVVAGTVSFAYDEIMELRAAASEIFDAAVNHPTPTPERGNEDELTVQLVVDPDKIEITMIGPENFTDALHGQQGEESRAVLRSLMDEVEFGVERPGKTGVRMLKYRSAGER